MSLVMKVLVFCKVYGFIWLVSQYEKELKWGQYHARVLKYSYIHAHNGLLFIDDFVEHIPCLVLLKDKLTYSWLIETGNLSFSIDQFMICICYLFQFAFKTSSVNNSCYMSSMC